MYKIAIQFIHKKGMAMKKTTVLIDEVLLQTAIEAIGARTKKEAIEAGLRTLVRNFNREALRQELGTFEIDLTLDELDRLRNAQ
jgi:Arc/MetJ family transcription regulator